MRIKKPDYKVAYVQLVSETIGSVSAHCLICVPGLFVQCTLPYQSPDLETWGRRSPGPSAPPQMISVDLSKSISYSVLQAHALVTCVWNKQKSEGECEKPQLCEDTWPGAEFLFPWEPLKRLRSLGYVHILLLAMTMIL